MKTRIETVNRTMLKRKWLGNYVVNRKMLWTVFNDRGRRKRSVVEGGNIRETQEELCQHLRTYEVV